MRRHGRARVEPPQVGMELTIGKVAGQGMRGLHREGGGLARAGGPGDDAGRRRARPGPQHRYELPHLVFARDEAPGVGGKLSRHGQARRHGRPPASSRSTSRCAAASTGPGETPSARIAARAATRRPPGRRRVLATGRLTTTEHAERLDAVYAAKTLGDLAPSGFPAPATYPAHGRSLFRQSAVRPG